jgi:hypothetical protein
MTKLVAALAVAVVAALPAPAPATFHLFQLHELFSTADGEVQFVVLRESAGANGENLLAGHALSATHGGATRVFTFPTNLPSSATANRFVLIASQGYADLRTAPVPMNLPAPDYIMPNRFLPTDLGTVDYAGVDTMSYAALPTDGTASLRRNGTTGPNVATNFAGTSGSVLVVPTTAVEFHHAVLDHYFQSSLAPDIAALDSGSTPGWARTGETFRVSPVGGTAPFPFVPVCRFYIPPIHGDSHFFSAWDVECSRILALRDTDPNYSGYVHETASAFYAVLPDLVTGVCPAGTRAAYRLWNGRVDSNHRFVTRTDLRTQMLARGYVAEGFGPDGVAMCVL